MANICDFSMFVRGKKENIEKFVDALTQNDNIYMGRGAADVEVNYNTDGSANIDGWCKWSVISALVNNAISMREEPDIWYWSNEKPSEIVTLWEACKKWNIIMEVYSEEPGMCFQEHYICDNGDIACKETVEYYEYYICDYSSKHEAEVELDIEITDEEWKRGDYVTRGGFEWDFEI